MQFNYLGESVPSLIDRMRAVRVSLALRAPLLALATATLVVTAWWFLERHWYVRAQEGYHRAQARLLAGRALLAAAKVERSSVEHLVLLDRQLRTIRSSGSLLGARVVDVANRIPDRVWLTSLVPTPSGVDINGRALGIMRLGETIAALGASKATTTTLVRATKEEHLGGQPLVAFELHLDE